MSLVDLDAKRAARAELHGPKEIRLGGETFTLPAELETAFVDATAEEVMGKVGFREAFRVLVGDEHLERFLATHPTVEDLAEIAQMYGVTLPESSASAPSSPKSGKPSRLTGKRTTG